MSKTLFIKSNCPECGARLNVNTTSDYIKCEYCGTTSRIADKKNSSQETNKPSQSKIEPVIWVSTGSYFSWTWIFAVILPIAISGWVFYSINNTFGLTDDSTSKISISNIFSGTGTQSTSDKSSKERMQWIGHKQPMLVDINGDGILDVLGWIRIIKLSSKNYYEHLAVFNPVSGQKLWDTGPLVASGQSGDVRAALAGDKLLFADSTGVLRGFSLANGSPVWQSLLGERAEKFCAAENGFALVHTRDKRVLRITLATGQVLPAGVWDSDKPCPLLQNDNDTVGPFFTLKDSRIRENIRIEGMNIDNILTNITNGKTIALGYRKPGTRVPVISAFENVISKNKNEGKVLWSSSVTTQNPLTLKEGSPEKAAAASDHIFVAYEMQESKAGNRLSCLNQNSGQIIWDVPIPNSDTGSIGGMTASAHHVFVAHWTYLDIFQLSDGVHVKTIGIW